MSRIGEALARPVAPRHPTLNTVLWAVAVAAILAAAGWRWHSAALAAPVLIPGAGEGSTIVLAVQDGDCPDRRAFMERWLARVTEGAPAQPASALQVARMGTGVGRLPRALDSLPHLGERQIVAVRRALLRSGVTGTPALLVVGPGGQPVLGAGFAQDGLELADAGAMGRILTVDASVPAGAGSEPRPSDSTDEEEMLAPWSP